MLGQLLAIRGCAGGAGCSCAPASPPGAADSVARAAAGDDKGLGGPVPLLVPAWCSMPAWTAVPGGLPEAGTFFPPPGPGPGMVPPIEAAEAALAATAAAAHWARAIWALALMSASVRAPVLLGLVMAQGKLGLGETGLVRKGAGEPWILDTGIWNKARERRHTCEQAREPGPGFAEAWRCWRWGPSTCLLVQAGLSLSYTFSSVGANA